MALRTFGSATDAQVGNGGLYMYTQRASLKRSEVPERQNIYAWTRLWRQSAAERVVQCRMTMGVLCTADGDAIQMWAATGDGLAACWAPVFNRLADGGADMCPLLEYVQPVVFTSLGSGGAAALDPSQRERTTAHEAKENCHTTSGASCP